MGKKNEIRGQDAHLIIPEESGVESGAAIFRKKVCEALEDVPTLERFEQVQDNVEIARPAPTDARDNFSAQAGRLPVLAP